jgi:hypothetical protein
MPRIQSCTCRVHQLHAARHAQCCSGRRLVLRRPTMSTLPYLRFLFHYFAKFHVEHFARPSHNSYRQCVYGASES